MPDNAKVGERIHQARRDLGLTQQQLADAIGVSHQSISAYERGDSLPSIDVAARLAALASVSLSWLLMGEDEKNNSSDTGKPDKLTADERRLIELYRFCDKHGKEAVRRVLEIAAVATGKRKMCRR